MPCRGEGGWLWWRLELARACRSSCGWYSLLLVLSSKMVVSWSEGARPGASEGGFMRRGSQSIEPSALLLLLVDGRELEANEGRRGELASLGRGLWWCIMVASWLLNELSLLSSWCLRALWLRKLRRKPWW